MKKVKEGAYLVDKVTNKKYKVLEVTNEELVVYEIGTALWSKIVIPNGIVDNYVVNKE